MTNKYKRGFTLVELLVVVLIVGILAAVALPQYRVAVSRTHFARLLTITRSIKDAQERYFMANGAYTTDFEQLDVQMPTPKSAAASARIYENGDQFNLVNESASTPWSIYARNPTVFGGNNTLLIASYTKSRMGGGIFCYAYADDKNAHSLCKSLGGVVWATGCSRTQACTSYRVLN